MFKNSFCFFEWGGKKKLPMKIWIFFFFFFPPPSLPLLPFHIRNIMSSFFLPPKMALWLWPVTFGFKPTTTFCQFYLFSIFKINLLSWISGGGWWTGLILAVGKSEYLLSSFIYCKFFFFVVVFLLLLFRETKKEEKKNIGEQVSKRYYFFKCAFPHWVFYVCTLKMGTLLLLLLLSGKKDVWATICLSISIYLSLSFHLPLMVYQKSGNVSFPICSVCTYISFVYLSLSLFVISTCLSFSSFLLFPFILWVAFSSLSHLRNLRPNLVTKKK